MQDSLGRKPNRMDSTMTETQVMSDPALPNKNATTIELTDDVSIRTVADLHQRLREALDLGSPVILDGARTEQADAAGLQILTAFIVSAKCQDVSCTWAGASAVLRNTAALLGLQTTLGLEPTPT
jgi:anti-anti-sigma regulatory factor